MEIASNIKRTANAITIVVIADNLRNKSHGESQVRCWHTAVNEIAIFADKKLRRTVMKQEASK